MVYPEGPNSSVDTQQYPVTSKSKGLDIPMVRHTLFSPLVKKNNPQVYSITIVEVENFLNLLSLNLCEPEEKLVTLAKHITVEYHEFSPYSSTRNPTVCPEPCPVNTPSPSWMASNLLSCLFTVSRKWIASMFQNTQRRQTVDHLSVPRRAQQGLQSCLLRMESEASATV